MSNEMKIREELYTKLEKELSEYKKGLLELFGKEIIDKSYETAIKEEIICSFYPESEKFDINEIKALKNQKNSLDVLYQGWMDSDLNICQLLEDNVYDTLQKLVEEQKEMVKQKKKNAKER